MKNNKHPNRHRKQTFKFAQNKLIDHRGFFERTGDFLVSLAHWILFAAIAYAIGWLIWSNHLPVIDTAEAHAPSWTIDITQNSSLDFGPRTYDTEVTAKFIAQYEGFSHTIIPDCSGKGYVIGFGFEPRERTWMSKKEGIRILGLEVDRLTEQIIHIYGYINQEKMTALVSILYNTPTYRAIINDDHVIRTVKTGTQEQFLVAFNHSIPGINIRREKEMKLYFNII